jgi:malonyl-CoA O-methyltransferase
VLRPGGYLLFSNLGPQTLFELRSAWASVDSYEHVNQFLPHKTFVAAAPKGLHCLSLSEELIQLRYKKVKELTHELKGIGAHNLNPGRLKGLAGRQRIQGFLGAYEGYRDRDGLLPATYQVYCGLFKKSALSHR